MLVTVVQNCYDQKCARNSVWWNFCRRIILMTSPPPAIHSQTSLNSALNRFLKQYPYCLEIGRGQDGGWYGEVAVRKAACEGGTWKRSLLLSSAENEMFLHVNRDIPETLRTCHAEQIMSQQTMAFLDWCGGHSIININNEGGPAGCCANFVVFIVL